MKTRDDVDFHNEDDAIDDLDFDLWGWEEKPTRERIFRKGLNAREHAKQTYDRIMEERRLRDLIYDDFDHFSQDAQL